jgi:hypothetical protein
MVGLRDLSVVADQSAELGGQIFRSEGVLVVRQFLPAPVTRAVGAFLHDALVRLDEVFRRYGFSMQDDDASARLAALIDQSPDLLPEKDRHIFLGHFPLEVRLAESLREIPRFINTHPLLFDLLATQRLFAHMPPTARYVLPHCSLAQVPPHQDISYNRHMGEFCVVWVPLVPIDSACGGMAVYPRTQNQEELLAGADTSSPADGWLRPIEGDTIGSAERVVLAPLELGDVVILGRRTIHESMPNVSNRVRLSCDFRFFGEQSHSTKHYLNLASDTIVSPAAAEE